MFRHDYSYLGDKKLRNIRTKTIDDYYHFLLFEAESVINPGKPKRENLTTSIIHDIHKVLRCAFNQAVKWEYIVKNPFLNATFPEHREKKRSALTPEQLQKIMKFTDSPDVYSHIMDENRKNNEQLFEQDFYSGAGKGPVKQEPQPEKAVAPESDTALLLKLLQNPDMANLLKTLAKNL